MKDGMRRKRIICMLLVLIQIAQILPLGIPARATESRSLAGDVNQDGIVDTADLSALSSHIAKIAPLTDEAALQAADLNEDGILSAADITMLASILESPEDLISITEVSVNQITGEAGSIFEWSVESEGGTGTVEYAFQLVDCSEDTLSRQANTVVAEQDYDTSDQFRVRIMDLGTYALSVTCRDEAGHTSTVSVQAPVTVTAPELQILQTTCTNTGTIFVGNELTWSVQTVGGMLPYHYRYTLYLYDTQIHSTESTESTYTWTTETPGTYLLEVNCSDSEGNTVSACSDLISVNALPTKPSAPPVLRTVNSEYSLAQTTSAAQFIPPEELRFCWEQVDNAESYELVLEWLNGDVWAEVSCEHVSSPEYAVSPDFIAGWSSNTLFRLRATAQGSISTEETISYFYSCSSAEPIRIDNLASLKWNISNAEGTARTFSVSSAFPWKATTDTEWISITKEDTGFTAKVSQNTDSERSGTITVSDGTSTATVLVTQGIGNGAPVLYYPTYSTNPDAPTKIPVGGMILGFDSMDSNYVNVRICEKSASGQLTEVYQAASPKGEEYLQVITSYSFKANTDYVIELSGSCTEEPENDAAKNFYYVRMAEKSQKILIDGSPAVTTDAFTSFSIGLYSSGAWTYTTDADWLYPEAHDTISYKKDYQSVDILLEPNETESTRTGTITFHCGSTSATLTVTQKSCLPRFITPSDVSQDENNPTVLSSKGLVEHAIYETGTYAYFENGTWSEEQSWGQSDEPREWSTLYPDDFFKTDILYRFTMHSGEHTAVYYVIFSDAVTQPYAVTRLGVEDYIALHIPFTAGECEETVKLSTSGAWSISSDSTWLSVSATEGSSAASKKTITISADENMTGTSRTGILTIQSENVICAKVTVTQAAEDYMIFFARDDDNDYIVYDPDTSFKHLDGSKNTVHFKVQSSLSHTVESADSWITCSNSKLTLAANTTGAHRTGTVVISCGMISETITVTQEAQMALPTLVSPSISTVASSPSIIENGDLELVINAIEGAVRYSISVSPADSNLLLPDSHFHSFEAEIQADGASSYSCNIPASAFSINAEECDDISIVAYDRFGYSVYDVFYLKTTNTDAALVNGSTTPVWDQATDIAVSKDFTVRSTGTWNAVSKASWIHLNRTNGNDNDVLSVTLDPNPGEARTGTVSITVGGSETVLTVNQCSWLPEFPSVTSPAFSDDPATPTIIGAGTTSLHVTWDYEPQAEYYKVSLLSFKSNSVQHVEASSSKLNTGEYTFENLILEPGQQYCIKISRDSHWGLTAKRYYFTLNDENAYVLVNNATTLEVEMDGDEDYDAVSITSSGVWNASVSDIWILVDNERIKQSDLDLDGYLPEDFDHYSGLSGQDLYISVLPNPTDTFRYGTVTVRCGIAESTISVIQEPHYTTADLYYPQLANTRQSSTSLPYGAVTLRWSGASGSTGKYSIILYERDPEKEYRYYEIDEINNITNTYYTLPIDQLTEGQYYKIWLGTDIKGTDDDPGRWYYFRMGYKNELVTKVTADWNAVSTEGFVKVSASASGGAGGYRFSYELLQNGQQVSITELDDWDYYTFNIKETGIYQVRVYVRDSANLGANALSATYIVGTSDLAQLKLSQSQWQVSATGGSTSITMDSYSSWKITSKPDWITASVSEGASGAAVTLTASSNTAGERSGYVTFSGSGKNANLFIQQTGNTLAEPMVSYPAANATVELQDLTASWNAVSGAGYYIFRLRDLTTDTLLMYETDLKTTNATIPAACLVNGHSYRIAVGAAHADDVPTSSSISWAEREFSVSAAADTTATVSGCVTDNMGWPLQGTVVQASAVDNLGNYIEVAQVETDASGCWSISGLKKGTTFAFGVYHSGYTFASDIITAEITESAHIGFNFQAENYYEQTVIYPGTLDFGCEEETDTLKIELSGSWTAKANASWIRLSAYSGTGATEVDVTVDEHSGEEPRTGTISITDQNSKTYTVEVFQEETVTVIHVAHQAGAAKTVVDIFDRKTGEYNGAPLVAGEEYSYEGDLKINVPLTIPTGASLNITGDVVIKSTVTFCSDEVEIGDYNPETHFFDITIVAYTELSCTGDLTVASKGIIDMNEGGKIHVGKDFIFKPKEKHDTELSKGIIEVGGNLKIQRNFYANGSNEVHLFATGRQHKINMWDKFGTKNDQTFNHLCLTSEGINALYIKEVFNCNSLNVANWDFLQQALFYVDDVNDTGDGPFVIFPSYDYTGFHKYEKAKRQQIITNIHVGLMRIIAEEGKVKTTWDDKLTIMVDQNATKTYSYRDANGNISYYTLTVKLISGTENFSGGFGTVTYTEGMSSMDFTIGTHPENIAAAVKEFETEVVKYAAKEIDDIMKEYMSLYNALMKELIAEVLGTTVDQLENTIKDAKKIKELIEKLFEEKSDLEKYYEIMSRINAAS